MASEIEDISVPVAPPPPPSPGTARAARAVPNTSSAGPAPGDVIYAQVERPPHQQDTPEIHERPPTPPTSNPGSDHDRPVSPIADVSRELGDLAKSLDHLSNRFGQFLDGHSRPTSQLGSTAGSVYMMGQKPPLVSLPGKENATLSVFDTEEDEVDEGGDENKERGNWTNHADFILSCLGYAVGLGNVWRFPYLCYKNGGGAFFIPYFIMLIFVGMPIVYLEISLGQFTSEGCLTCWNFAPILGGVGISHFLISALINIYYNIVLAWSIYYLFASFTDHLPWSDCNNWWNTATCRDKMPDVSCNQTDVSRSINGTCLNVTTQRSIGVWNTTALKVLGGIERTSASSEYYNNYVLGRSESFDTMGNIRWELALCLLCGWLVIFFCLSKGIKSSGKAVYFTALFPYLVLLILLIRGVTLPGYYDGILYYTTPDFNRLASADVWVDAAVQIFFSLSACMGGLITLSSYNRFRNNCLRDTLIVCAGNSLTSIFAGFVVFSFLGYQAHVLNTTVDKVATDGPGLAFVVYPDAISKMPIAPFWSILFFVMLFTLGLDSQFAGVECVVSGLIDKFPSRLRGRNTLVLAVVCFVCFFLGLSMTAEGGVYMLTLFDNSAGGWAMLVVGICESVGLTWVYGPRRLVSDLRMMCGNTILLAGPLPYYWLACWCVITPVLLTAIILFGWIDWSPLSYEDYVFPIWADTLGILMTVLCVIFIPIYAVYAILSAKGTFLQRLWDVSSPSADWGPALPKNRRLVARYTDNMVIYPDREAKEMKEKEDLAENGTNYDNPVFSL